MSTYQIITGTGTCELSESGGVCVSATGWLDWAVGLPYNHVRHYAELKGWVIVPQLANEPTQTDFEFHNCDYVLTWKNNKVIRITKDGEPITWRELPDQLKGLL
jgi:hypothetical protein